MFFHGFDKVLSFFSFIGVIKNGFFLLHLLLFVVGGVFVVAVAVAVVVVAFI